MRQIIYFLMVLTAFWVVSCAAEKGSEQAEQTSSGEQTTPEETKSESTFAVKVTDESKASPRKMLSGTIGETTIAISYSSPSVKGRTIWGDLIPYGEVWRTGADEATTIEFNGDVVIEGQELPKGRYAFFTIPYEENWTLIFNKEADQFGAFNYQESEDIMRVAVEPKAMETASETMEFAVEGATIMLMWDKLMVPFTLTEYN